MLAGNLLAAAALFAAMGLQQPLSAAESRPDDPSARDLLQLVDWFEGEFDNQEQVWFETEGRAQVPPKARHERVHATHRRVAMPQFGAHVFYVEEYLDDDESKVFRQRLVTFESARAAGVRMKLWFFKDAAAVRGAHREPAKLAELTSASITTLPECDVYWTAQAGQYVGAMRPRACQFGSGAQRRYSQHDLQLSADKYWRIDRTFLVAGDVLAVGLATGEPHRMNRAKVFLCKVTFQEKQSFESLRLHSQGGAVRLRRDADGKSFQLRLRDKEYPYYESRPDFMFLSVREGEGPFIAYSLHDPGAEFLGFNLGWMSATCERQSPPQTGR